MNLPLIHFGPQLRCPSDPVFATLVAQALAPLILPDLQKEITMQLNEIVSQYKSALETVTAAANAGAAKIQALTSENQGLAAQVTALQAQIANAGVASDQEAADAANDVNAANQASAAVNALVNPPQPQG